MVREPRVSVIVPVFNEAESLGELIPALVQTLSNAGQTFEIVAVNDGSTDNSENVLAGFARSDPRVRCVSFARNFGQTAALMAGLDSSSGEIIVPIDADLQNDPDDIPRLLNKLDEGYDVVSGWRRVRKDAYIRRTFLSRCANWLISAMTGVRLHDYGCSLKAYRRQVLGGVRLYGEMHRFIPIYASWYGARIVELEVNHRPRRYGRSSYGLSRIIKVTLDLMVVCFLARWLAKPIYVFGGFGLLWLLLSAISFAYLLWLKFVHHQSMILTPLPILVAITFMMGVTSILIGLLAEMVVRVYYESQAKLTYFVRESRVPAAHPNVPS